MNTTPTRPVRTETVTKHLRVAQIGAALATTFLTMYTLTVLAAVTAATGRMPGGDPVMWVLAAVVVIFLPVAMVARLLLRDTVTEIHDCRRLMEHPHEQKPSPGLLQARMA